MLTLLCSYPQATISIDTDQFGVTSYKMQSIDYEANQLFIRTRTVLLSNDFKKSAREWCAKERTLQKSEFCGLKRASA